MGLRGNASDALLIPGAIRALPNRPPATCAASWSHCL
jgi:hypothetical protein